MRNDAKTMQHEIMLVEYDEATRALYTRELGREYQVFACSDEHGALALLRRHDIRVVVLEPGRPDGRGWALLSTLKHTSDTQNIPVILCSTLDERKRGLELGASAYLIKPVLPTMLLEAVRRFIDKALL
jgi:DNA-binding response OmpR family regulator